MDAPLAGRRLTLISPCGRRLPTRAACTALCALALLVPAAHAQASVTRVDFESPSLSDATQISDQYAAAGVTFISSAWLPDYPRDKPEVRVVRSAGAAPNHALQVAPQESELAVPGVAMQFTTTRAGVDLNVRNISDAPFGLRAQLRAYDASGTRVDTNGGSYQQLNGAHTNDSPLHAVTANGHNDIATVLLVADPRSSSLAGQRLQFDDLTLTTNDALGAAPDYLIGPAGRIAVVQGQSSHVDVPLALLNGFQFNGHVFFRVTGLPARVRAVVSRTSQTELRVTVSASGDAVPTTILASLEGVGTPARRAPLSIVVEAARANVDVRITGIEVTQGIQSLGGAQLPTADPSRAVPYAGVHLVENRTTFVRVFADTTLPSRGDGTTPAVSASLRLSDERGSSHQPITLLPQNGPQDLSVGGPSATFATRSAPAGYFVFAVPGAEAFGTLRMSVTINDGFDPVVECPTCGANDVMTVGSIPFYRVRPIEIFPVRLVDNVNGQHAPVGAPEATFSAARAAYPVPFTVFPWQATIDISGALRDAAAWNAAHPPSPGTPEARAEGWILPLIGDREIDHFRDVGATVGVGRGSFVGMTAAPTFFCCWPPRWKRPAAVEQQRPFTSVSHELGHQEGLNHADHQCRGNENGEISDDWPDPRGSINGVGFDPVTLTPRPWIDAGFSIRWYDFMSYCAHEGDSQLSAINWDRLVNHRLDNPRIRQAIEAVPIQPGPGLAVSASVTPDGIATITSVRPTPDGGPGDDVAGKDTLSVVGADGKEISRTRVAEQFSHVDSPGGPETLAQVSAVVPADQDPRAIVLRRGEETLAERTASPHAPVIQIVTPHPKAKVPSHGALEVRWRAVDPDGDQVRVDVDYSPGPKAPFRTLASEVTDGHASIPVGGLAPSHDGQIRVRASDGFREAMTTIGPLRVAGAPPTVSLLAPTADSRLRADGTLSLEGQAIDAMGTRLTGGALHWRLAGRAVGIGEFAEVEGLRPGRHVVELVATDNAKRRSTVRTTIRVSAVPPRLLEVRAPAIVSRTTRSVVLRLSSSVPAAAIVIERGPRGSRTTASIGRRLTPVRTRIRPGLKPVALTVVLRAGRATHVQRVWIKRA